MSDALTILTILVIILVGSVLLVWPFAAMTCHARWDNSGMPVRYGLFSTCQIQSHGKWIPADAYREIEP